MAASRDSSYLKSFRIILDLDSQMLEKIDKLAIEMGLKSRGATVYCLLNELLMGESDKF
jgi:hypothetical protein